MTTKQAKQKFNHTLALAKLEMVFIKEKKIEDVLNQITKLQDRLILLITEIKTDVEQ